MANQRFNNNLPRRRRPANRERPGESEHIRCLKVQTHYRLYTNIVGPWILRRQWALPLGQVAFEYRPMFINEGDIDEVGLGALCGLCNLS